MPVCNRQNFLKCFCLVLYVLGCYILCVFRHSSYLKFPIYRSINPTRPADNLPRYLTVRNASGHIILKRTIEDLWHQPLRKWDYKEEILSFIHIEKCGGTSFYGGLKRSSLKNGCGLKCTRKIHKLENRTCPTKLTSLCGSHFDWSHLHHLENVGLKSATVIFIRHPVDRFVSHYTFAKFLRSTGSPKYPGYRKYIAQNLDQYLTDPESMWESRPLWYDGQVKYFSSTYLMDCLA